MTIADAAKYLSFTPWTIRHMIAEGQITARRFGKRAIRVDFDSLVALGRPVVWGGETA
ncbi:helix-turn-helix domain-containing protein [Humibacter antri]